MRRALARAVEIAGAAIILLGAVWFFSGDVSTLFPQPSPALPPPAPVHRTPVLGEIPEGAPMSKLVTQWGDPPSPDCRGVYQVGGSYNGKPYYYATIGGTLFYVYYNGVDAWWIADGDLGVPYLYWWYCESATETGDGDYYPYGGVSGYPRVGEVGDADLQPPPPPETPVFTPDPRTRVWGLTQFDGGLEPSLWPEEETVTVDKWYRPLSEPARVTPRPVATGEESWGPDPSLWSASEEITLDKWYQPLSEPLRITPQPIRTGTQYFRAEPTDWPGPEVVTVDKWYSGDLSFARPVWPAAVYSVIPPLVEHSTGPLNRYYVDLRGLFRIFNDAEYWLYRSATGPPAETDSPFATASSLPSTPPDTYADGTWYLSVAWFNGVLSSGFLPVGPHGETYLRLDLSGGVQVGSPPIGPISWHVEARAAGVARIHAVIYLRGDDADPAQWAIAYTINGSTPAEDSADVTLDLKATGGQFLVYDLPAQANGTTIKVRLQTRRNDGSDETPSWVYSEGSTVLTITADASGPSAPLDAETWPGTIDE